MITGSILKISLGANLPHEDPIPKTQAMVHLAVLMSNFWSIFIAIEKEEKPMKIRFQKP